MEILSVDNLRVQFDVRDKRGRKALLRAVDGVDFVVNQGETVGLVGESGCGKTTAGNAVIGMAERASGEIRYKGENIDKLLRNDNRAFRREIQMVFQDPFGSLNPRMTIGSSIGEVLKIHRISNSKADRAKRIAEALESVGLESDYASRYPHEFSGGQRQRLGIARALALGPSLVIADEPVSALDVSVQVQILNLMLDLQKERNLSYLFIAHDLAVVRYMCDTIHVMYLGRIVESGEAREVFERPAHPYTEALLSAVPDVAAGLQSRHGKSERIVLQGDVPSATETISGCPFHTRCHRAGEICRTEAPPRIKIGSDHTSVCHFAEKIHCHPIGGSHVS